jgi:hypothetical protein
MAVIPFAKEKPERQLTSWIESFLEATEGLPVPRIFLKWSAISAIAGALERKVWVRMNRMNLYPNMYILLIADPGVGKTVSATQTEILWRGLKNHHVAPTNATKAGLIDVLAESAREVTLPRLAGVDKFHALNIMASELGAFMPSYEGEFMNTLTTLWDGGHYSERKRTGQLKVDIPKPTLNMLACATPDFMNKFMPEGAWKQGFASRLLMIYSSEMILSDLWSEDNHASAMGTYYDDLRLSSLPRPLKPLLGGIEVARSPYLSILSLKVMFHVGQCILPKCAWCELSPKEGWSSFKKITAGASIP